ncbi:Uncharacterised protein [Klebsiella pneumoniae]|uniref:Uncharacterized protein n=1 Tax=Klebsiella pneumoniae TaxID=573 RepID=A0A3S4IQH8_KLEPN|nr:Uncharacterised protein [Klebsiella pneumoniae]
METLRPLDTRHILNPYAFCFRHRLTFTTAHRDKLFFIFGNRFALTQFQFVKGITMTFQQLRLFDGEITVTGETRVDNFYCRKKRLVVVKLSAILHAPDSLAELFMARSISYA